MKVVYLTDLHAGNPDLAFPWAMITSDLARLIRELGVDDTVLAISGDVTFRGAKSGYLEAARFVQDVIDASGLDRRRVILCPGNHDICPPPQRLAPFDAFSAQIRHDGALLFSDRSVVIHYVSNVAFIVLNSAYRLEHDFGAVDLEGLQQAIAEHTGPLAAAERRIAVTHHHFINQFLQDTSVTRNAYPVLHELTAASVDLIIHGHQHAFGRLVVGGRTQLFGISSYNFRAPDMGVKIYATLGAS